MDDSLAALIVEELGRLRPRNEIILDVCVHGELKWQEAELLVALVEKERAHAIVRKQGPWLIAMSVLLIVVGLVPYALALGFAGILTGAIPPPTAASGMGIEITIPIPLSTSGWAEAIGGCVASFTVLGGGIVGLYETVRRYRET